MAGHRTGAVASALAVVLAAVVALATACGPAHPTAPPAPPDRQAPPPADAAGQVVLEQLGGLAALAADDPLLEECAGPETLPAVTGDDPVTVVQRRTEQIRGLEPPGSVRVELLDDAEMTQRVAGAFGSQWSRRELDLEQRVLTALGAVPPGTDLRTLRVDVFAAQVSGYFLGSQDRIAVPTADPDTLTPLEQVVVAHEWEHALTWHNLARPEADTTDGQLAVTAVVEGSAALTMRMYAHTALSDAERDQMWAELAGRAAGDELAGFSPYLRAELRFPYLEGMRYLCARWADGGWEAVNAAFTDPPRTTAEVLFPERRGQVPRRPEPLGDPGAGWREAADRDLGAAELEWLLAAPGADPDAALSDPRGRVAAWGGGWLVLWTDEPLTAVGLALVDRGGAPSLCVTVQEWYAAAFPDATVTGSGDGATFTGPAQHAALSCEDEQVRLGIAPDPATASAIAG